MSPAYSSANPSDRNVKAGDGARLLKNSNFLRTIVDLLATLPTSEPTAIADKYQLWNNGGSIAFVSPAW